MELDANKIMEGVLARVGAKKSTLLDFNPGPSRHFLEELVVDGASIFGDTKSWYLHNKEENMEKRKMTKAEAFKWLTGKKIRTGEKHEWVLRKLFELGFVWKTQRDTTVDLGWMQGEVYGLSIREDEVSWWSTPKLFDTYAAEEVSADEVLNIEIVEDTRSVEDRLIDLAKPIMELLHEQGMTDSVRITSRSVVLEPMALFLHGQILED